MRRMRSTTTTRVSQGRERALAADPLPLVLTAALDVLARHRASTEPLERSLAEVTRQRHLGKSERRTVGDLVFGWARRQGAAEQMIDAAVAAEGGLKPSRRDRDLCVLVMAQAAAGLEVDARAVARLSPALAGVAQDIVERGFSPSAADSLPAWLREAVRRTHDDPALLTALATPAPLTVAVDLRATKIDDVIDAVLARGIHAERSPVVEGAVRIHGRLPLHALPEHLRATIWPMDDGSQAVAHALGAQAGELIADLCAGGGGKTRLLTTTGARVIAADINAERLSAARSRWRVRADGLMPPFRRGTFDRVLLDAPCSGTGTLRRAPDLAQRLEASAIADHQALQRRLLEAAIPLVKPGGRIVYATCSLLREENDDVVNSVLAQNPALRLAPMPWVGRVHIDGSAGRAHLLPSIHGTDGFYVASLELRG